MEAIMAIWCKVHVFHITFKLCIGAKELDDRP